MALHVTIKFHLTCDVRRAWSKTKHCIIIIEYVYRLARGVLKAESELSEGEAGVAGVAGDAALASIESSVHDVVVSSFTESAPNLPVTITANSNILHYTLKGTLRS